jgi:hypothetical protein
MKKADGWCRNFLSASFDRSPFQPVIDGFAQTRIGHLFGKDGLTRHLVQFMKEGKKISGCFIRIA